MLRFRDFLLLEYNEDKNWANHGPKITERLKSQGVESNHKEFWHNQIQDHDPTPNKEYAGWISQKYATGGIRHHEDIGSRVGPALETYHKHKLKKTLETHGVPKDIGAIKNITHLEDSVDKLPSLHKDDNSKVNDSEVTKHDEKHWKVYTPHTEEASKKYGAGTRWCTAAHKNNQFENYNDEGPMHIYVPKKPRYPGEKYQGHRETFSFMNEKDEPVKDEEVFKDRPSSHHEKHGVTEEHLDKLFSNRGDGSWYDALQHSKINGNHLHKILDSGANWIKEEALEHKKITAEHITKALGDKSAFVRAAAMRSEHVTSAHIHKALDDEDTSVRLRSMWNENAKPEHIHKALDDDNEYIQKAAINHKNATPENIHKALDDKDIIAKIAIEKQNVNNKNISKALDHKDINVARIAASKQNINSENITKALTHSDKWVRHAALNSPNVNINHIRTAEQDPDREVRDAARLAKRELRFR